MSFTALVTASALGLVSLPPVDSGAPKELMLAQAQPFISTQGVVAPRGEYRTMSNGCVYRKTQAPGYPPRWILVINPQRLGMPKPRGRCSGMM
ncbi:hypothetical protein [Pacificoceanicola onchidii]|uniref:hypothetical protein n=1 Tax=Pacificoceanicola onchidii TaxID=2562685 RepID=UPI0010A65023|nr:hypothetical protein [Pacificoceanicola onchidii]